MCLPFARFLGRCHSDVCWEMFAFGDGYRGLVWTRQSTVNVGADNGGPLGCVSTCLWWCSGCYLTLDFNLITTCLRHKKQQTMHRQNATKMDDISPRNTNKVAGNESNDIRWDWITLWLFMMPQSTTFHNINWMHPWPIYCIKMGLLTAAPATPTHNNPTISVATVTSAMQRCFWCCFIAKVMINISIKKQRFC